MKFYFLSALLSTFICLNSFAEAPTKVMALTFDDAPMPSTGHFKSIERTKKLIAILNELRIPSVMIFANGCKNENKNELLEQLNLYIQSGHSIENHTCKHPRLDEVGASSFKEDIVQNELVLKPLLSSEKFFRYPYLNEGEEVKVRDEIRNFLDDKKIRNAVVTIDNDDYLFSAKINAALDRNKKIDYQKIEKKFIEHVVEASEYYNEQSLKLYKRPIPHVLLLHEMDATILFLKPLLKELKKRGWVFISAKEAYKDPLYFDKPKNTYAQNGFIAQVSFEKTGEKIKFAQFDKLKKWLNHELSLNK